MRGAIDLCVYMRPNNSGDSFTQAAQASYKQPRQAQGTLLTPV